MKIGVIDADLLGRKNHRFPNLACMKISGYHKQGGNKVDLLLDYDDIEKYDKVFISKVFMDTPIPINLEGYDNVVWGGTGFFYDKAKPLQDEIEHHIPDYFLYNKWVNDKINNGEKRDKFTYYLDYSIGFTTRGCFRQCEFCVNQNYTKVSKHSPLSEFLDIDRKYICLLDDNILGYGGWKEILTELQETKKYFQYKQGMDERTLTEEKCKILSSSKYKGDYIFAFDDINDKEIIIDKLKLWKKYCTKTTKFYVFCGFDREDKWDDDFWKQDIIDTFERIKILMQHGCLPYIMRFTRYEESPHKGMYINLARWCNQPSFYKKKSFRQYCIANGENSSTVKYMNEFEIKYPEIAMEYFNLRYEDLKQY